MATTLLNTADAPSGTTGDAARRAGGKFLTFRLAREEFGVAILKVREINKILDITAVPRMGVVNLRGKVIPVIDLRLKFSLPEAEHTEQTCVIVVDVGQEIGVIVDTVSEVLDISGANIEPPPSMGASVDASFILGMGKVGTAVKILLDIDRVLNAEQLDALLTPAAQADSAGKAGNDLVADAIR